MKIKLFIPYTCTYQWIWHNWLISCLGSYVRQIIGSIHILLPASTCGRDDIGKLSVLTAHFKGNLSVDSTHKRRGELSVGVFIIVSVGNLLNSQSSCRLFEISWRSCDVAIMRRTEAAGDIHVPSHVEAKFTVIFRRHFQMHWDEIMRVFWLKYHWCLFLRVQPTIL